MNKEIFNTWTEKFGGAWASLDSQGALDMLSKDVKYYESPLSEPCSTWEEVEKLWSVVSENQKDVKFSHTVAMSEGDLGLINWQVTRTLIPSGEKQEIDGIFLIRLNNQGLCTEFKQWRAVK